MDAAREHAIAQDLQGDADSATLQVLLSDHGLEPMQVAQALADEFSMDVVDLTDVQVDPGAIQLISYDLANKYKVFPIHADETEVQLAICDPLDMDAIDSIGYRKAYH